MRRLTWIGFLILSACASPPPTPPVAMPSLADIVKTCAFEVSCLQSPLTKSLQTCVSVVVASVDKSRLFRRYVDCARGAATCADVLACASLGHDAAWCAAHPGNSCDGDVVVPCSTQAPFDAAIMAEDCAAVGMHCATAGVSAFCTDGASCDARQSGYCDGNFYVTCNVDAGLRSRLDCSRSDIANATCRREDQYTIGCFPTGPSCNGADRCDGNVRVACSAGEEFRVICAQRCENGQCVEDGPACDAHNTPDACDAAAISTCALGTLESVDCSAIGLAACGAASDGSPVCR